MNNKELIQYVIFDHPSDHPHFFVVREMIIGRGTFRHGRIIALTDTLDQARAKVLPGMACIPRYPEDDPVIVEVWM